MLIDGIQIRKLVDQYARNFPQEKILIFCFCENTVDAVALYLAALQSHQAICLLDGKSTPEIKERLIRHYQPHFIFDEGNLKKHSLKKSDIHPDLQLLLSTSGTTGSPKLIRLTKKNIMSNAHSIAEYLNITKDEVTITSLPIHYSYGLSVLNSHLIRGAKIVLTNSTVVQKPFWDLFRYHSCTSFAGVPYTYQLLEQLRFENFSLPSLKTMTQAGGKLTPALIEKFHHNMVKRGGKFYVMYGQTEATARISYLPPQLLPEKSGAIGKPIPGGKLSLYDGELIYEGANVMMGYAEGPEDLGKGDELNGLLRTGDLGKVDREGIFYVTGRKKRISKVYGLRINLDEVEEVLRIDGPVAVTGTDSKIFIHYRQDTEKNFQNCVHKLSYRFQLHPTTFQCCPITQFPLTPSGKIDYQKLENFR